MTNVELHYVIAEDCYYLVRYEEKDGLTLQHRLPLPAEKTGPINGFLDNYREGPYAGAKVKIQ